MIKLEAFMAGVQAIIDLKPLYKLGHSGTDGYCDCIGLIIGAIRRAGGTWSGTHGSNYAARNQMQTMKQNPVIESGAVLYKAFMPGDPGYNLPSTYANSPDQKDYYHVGVVLSVKPLRIAHCTSWGSGSGIKIDTAIGRWRFGGRLKHVDYQSTVGEGGVPMSAYATVSTVTPGETVRLRSTPDTKTNNVIANIRDGGRVFVLDQGGEWWKVNDGQKTGYMMSRFLRLESDPAAPTDETIEAILLKARALIDEAIAKTGAS